MKAKAIVAAMLAAALSFGVTLHAGEGKKCEGGKCTDEKVATKSDKKAGEKKADQSAEKSGEQTNKKDEKKAS